MVAQITPPFVTAQQYLEQERRAETKSEYHNGVILAMAGASEAHNSTVFNLVTELGIQLKGTPCRGYAADMRVRVPDCNRYYYPDILVACGERRFEDAHGDTLLNPTLIIEVLAPSTERVDREEKQDCYRTLSSLTTYVLVTQDRPRVERFLRQDDTWQHEVANRIEAVIALPAIHCLLRLSDVYSGITFLNPSPTLAPPTTGS